MKRIIICLLLVLTSISAFSQKEFKVVSLKQSSSDISARTNQREDINGDACALVKVQLPLPNAYFEGDIIGRTAHKTNEYWVYMPKNTGYLTIKLSDYSPLLVNFKDFGLPMLESKTTYELCILPKEPNAPQLYDEGMTALVKNDVITAYEKLEKAANAGFAYANYVLGSIQIQPYEVPEGYEWIEDPNPEEIYQTAYDYYKKAADANIPEALYALGSFLTQYKITKENIEKDPDIAPMVSNIYKAKVSPGDCAPSYISSIICKAADLGNADAQWKMCSEKKWCEDNAKKGIAIAEFAMGLRCDTTFYDDTYDYPNAEDIIPNEDDQRQINYEEAFKWYEKAAEKGLDAAQWKLGYMYALGLGVEKNLEKSLYWRKMAAEQGYIVYQLEMAMSYNYGVISDLATYESWGTSENGMPAWDAEIPCDAKEADCWLRKVSNRELITSEERHIIDGNSMYSDAMYILAKRFQEQGKYEKSIYWLQRVGEKNGEEFYKPYALEELGRIFYEGLAGEKNYTRAIKYLEEGVEVGGNMAACYLGLLYRDGLGVPKDYEKAKEYLMQSLDMDESPRAQYELGLLYKKEGDLEKARSILFKGGVSGDVITYVDGEDRYVEIDDYYTKIIFERGLMNFEGLGGEKNIDKAIEQFKEAASRGHEEAKQKLTQLGVAIPKQIEIYKKER